MSVGIYKTAPGIDRTIVAVSDIESAAHDYELMLGFPPSWRGHQHGSGTRNVLFRLENTCLELLAVDQPGSASDLAAAFIESQGEGLAGLVYSVDDIEVFSARLQSRGVPTEHTQNVHERDDRRGAVRHWRRLQWPLEASRGIYCYAIQADSPSDILPVRFEGLASEVRAVDHIVISTSDGDAAAAFYGDTLGLRLALRQDVPQWGGDMLFFRTSQLSLEVIASTKNNPLVDSLWGIALRTENIEAAHRRLCRAGVAVSAIRDGRKPGTRVCTVKSHCCAIPTLLVGQDGAALE